MQNYVALSRQSSAQSSANSVCAPFGTICAADSRDCNTSEITHVASEIGTPDSISPQSDIFAGQLIDNFVFRHIITAHAMHITVAPTYNDIRRQIEERVTQKRPQGEILRDARNLIVRCDIGGKDLVIKRYGKPFFFNRIMYTFFRTCKPKRAYINAQKLAERGYDTPEAVAFTTHYSCGLYESGAFVCPYCAYPTVESAVANPDEVPHELLDALARYTAKMHHDGIYFYDYNLGNILYHRDAADGQYRFTLIDCNRIKFYDKPISPHKCVKVLYCLNFSPEQHIYFMCRYAKYRDVHWKLVSGAVLLRQELNPARRFKRWIKGKIGLTGTTRRYDARSKKA